MDLTLKETQQIMQKNGGNLDLKWRQIESLPDNLVVYGNLDMYCCPIKTLPKGLVVYGNLVLSKTLVECLPDDLIVGGNIELDNTPLKYLPKEFVVSGYLDLSYTPIETLPSGLVVGKSLYLSKTRITTLPSGLVIGDSIDLRETWISNLPNDIIINGRVYSDIVISGNPARRYLQNGDYIPGRYIYANGTLVQVEHCSQMQEYYIYYGRIDGQNVVSNGVSYVLCNNIQNGIYELSLHETTKSTEKHSNSTLKSIVELNGAMTIYSIIKEAREQDVKKASQI